MIPLETDKGLVGLARVFGWRVLPPGEDERFTFGSFFPHLVVIFPNLARGKLHSEDFYWSQAVTIEVEREQFYHTCPRDNFNFHDLPVCPSI